MADSTALDEFPRELSLTERRGRAVLEIHGPDLSGQASSTSPECVLAVAEAYAAMRREQQAGSAL